MQLMRATVQRLLQFGERLKAQNYRHPAAAMGVAVATGLMCSTSASASFTAPYSLSQFTLSDLPTCFGQIPNSSAATFDGGLTVLFTGSNSGSGCNVTSKLTIAATTAGSVSYAYAYALEDDPGFDTASYIVGSTVTPLAMFDGDHGTVSFLVAQGQIFGFQIDSDDQAGTGKLTISNFNFTVAGVPEPGTLGLAAVSLAALAAWRRRAKRSTINGILGLAAIAFAPAAFSQTYVGFPVPNIMQKTAVVNLSQLAGLPPSGLRVAGGPAPAGSEFPPKALLDADLVQSRGLGRLSSPSFSLSTFPFALTTGSLPITNGSLPGFNGLTHKDQRDANNDTQFSIEPPNQSIAASNDYILEGVNNAVRVFSITGTPLLPTLTTNQVFSVLPAIDRVTGVHGPFGTDMRVFYDQTLARWFILQRAVDNTTSGALLASSTIYIAVSQTSDPTQTYTIYKINSTDPSTLGCPCIADYPQIGSDQYGFYIAANEYDAPNGFGFKGATIYAISKASLAANADFPTVVRFNMSNGTGYEFSLQPATTAPGSSSFLASGGVEYFVSTISQAAGSSVAVWAMYNTGSLNNQTPTLTLVRTLVPTIQYSFPPLNAQQKNGPIPLGSNPAEYFPPFTSPRTIDGGDSRVQSVTYAAGKLYVSWATFVIDENMHSLTGTAYVVLTPAFRSLAVTAKVNAQGTIQVLNNNLLRPYWAVNKDGKGAMAFTLVGPDYYPSAAFVTADSTTIGSSVQIVGAGTAPEDGFTGYDQGIARWGDYNGAVVAPDGSIWMVSQYIPNLPRSLYANWGTYIFRYVP